MVDLIKHSKEPENQPDPQPIPMPMPAYYGMPGMGGIPCPMPAVQPKKKTEFTAAELVFSIAVFALSFLLIRFAVCSPTGFVTTAVFALLITAALIFMKKSGVKGSGRTALTAGIMYLFSCVYFVTDNDFIKNLNTVFLILCGLWLLYQYGSEDRRVPRFLPFVMMQAAVQYPLEQFGRMPEAAVEGGRRTKVGRSLGSVLIGLAVAVVPTIIIGGLLVSADSGVEKMLGGLSDIMTVAKILPTIIQLCFAVPVGCYIFGAFYANAHRNRAEDVTEDTCAAHLAKWQKVGGIVTCTALTPVCVLYTMFFVSQANYLLSAFMNRLPEGFSHAEYARRGFFELLAVIIINIFIIMIANIVTKENGGKSAALRIYTAAVSFFTLVMIASALSKMVMYISEYGLSELRLYTGWFMVLCAFAFVLVIVKQIKRGLAIMRPLAAVFIVMFGLLTFGRPDYVIARFNVEMYNAGYFERLDTEYLWSLSDDAKMYCMQSGNMPEDIDSNVIRRGLDAANISSMYVTGFKAK
ncbi:MAG: DUF4173 domain-containing protein [Ruminococcus sp.]|nr:DUF4173 domain-containing protein [Ruminococcus sp.]